MATFNTKETLYGSPSLIPTIAGSIQETFVKDGYEVSMDALSSGGYDISITKGGIFKAVLGMKTALKVTLLPQDGNIYFEAGVGIWGQQAIPTVISMLFFWPVLITQIWGLIEQSQIDDKALQLARNVIVNTPTQVSHEPATTTIYCTACGAQNTYPANYCCNCGTKL